MQFCTYNIAKMHSIKEVLGCILNVLVKTTECDWIAQWVGRLAVEPDVGSSDPPLSIPEDSACVALGKLHSPRAPPEGNTHRF